MERNWNKNGTHKVCKTFKIKLYKLSIKGVRRNERIFK